MILFDYDSDGRVLGYRIASDRETVERCQELHELALTPLCPSQRVHGGQREPAR